jgi:hypothetical protein
LRQRAERGAEIARREAPGRMGDFISSYIQDGPRGLEAVVVCTHPAVRFVLDGTRPHIIRPRNARALRFDVGGRTVHAKIVHHPGTRANFLARALIEGR